MPTLGLMGASVGDCLSMAIPARACRERSDLIILAENVKKAAVIDTVSVRPVSHPAVLAAFLNGRSELSACKADHESIWNAGPVTELNSAGSVVKSLCCEIALDPVLWMRYFEYIYRFL